MILFHQMRIIKLLILEPIHKISNSITDWATNNVFLFWSKILQNCLNSSYHNICHYLVKPYHFVDLESSELFTLWGKNYFSIEPSWSFYYSLSKILWWKDGRKKNSVFKKFTCREIIFVKTTSIFLAFLFTSPNFETMFVGKKVWNIF